MIVLMFNVLYKLKLFFLILNTWTYSISRIKLNIPDFENKPVKLPQNERNEVKQ
jgi:hypothetical protein